MNPENRKQIIVLGVLVGGLVLVGGYQYFLAGGGGDIPPTDEDSGDPANTEENTRISQPKFEGDLAQLLAGIEQVTFDYRRVAGDRPSPMQPKIADGPIIDNTDGGQRLRDYDVQRLRITGIIWDEAAPYAVVEGEVVWNGYDYGNGLKVHAIEKDCVRFELDGLEIPVEMEER